MTASRIIDRILLFGISGGQDGAPATGSEGEGGDSKPANDGGQGGVKPTSDASRLADDHPVVVALNKANKEAEAARLEKKQLAAKLKEYEDAGKSELEKAQTRIAEADFSRQEAEARALRMEVAMDKGLTVAQAKRLVGTTKEELEKDADELLKEFGGKPEDKKKPASRRPDERLRGGTNPEEEGPTDVSKILEQISRY